MEEYIDRIKSIVDCTDIELISDTSNKVFKITTENDILYAKFYLGNSYHVDNELKVYDLVDNKYLKEIYYKDSDMAIFKELKGRTIDELSNEELDNYKTSIIDAICTYFDSISKTKTEGYGKLDTNLKGRYESFIEFLKTRQMESSEYLSSYDYLSKVSSKIFDKYEDILISDTSLTPIDTNMKNIMLLDDNTIKLTDPGEMISGPILMAYGDFTAHTYKTVLYDELFKRLNLDEDDIKRLRIYAVFSSINILAFLAKLGVGDLDKVIPYGNKYSFYELIKEHMNYLDIE